jgi:hypothetical protein
MPGLHEEFIGTIKVLDETIWEGQAKRDTVEAWLSNFEDAAAGTEERQKLHMLYLLSRFMYFGRREIRALLHSLYRDLYRYPIVESIRRVNSDTSDEAFLGAAFLDELTRTRFLGMGNPSESGTHLLYYFRQENSLPRELFINAHDIFSRVGGAAPGLRNSSVTRYVFVDDFCGSGTQAEEYSQKVVEDIKRIEPKVQVAYYALFATEAGIAHVRSKTCFDQVGAVFELDDSYKCFEPSSRYFRSHPSGIDPGFAKSVAAHYGQQLVPAHELGFKNGQLLIGFYHNTPDNTLPIVWFSAAGNSWIPMFRRYPKFELGGVI